VYKFTICDTLSPTKFLQVTLGVSAGNATALSLTALKDQAQDLTYTFSHFSFLFFQVSGGEAEFYPKKAIIVALKEGVGINFFPPSFFQFSSLRPTPFTTTFLYAKYSYYCQTSYFASLKA